MDNLCHTLVGAGLGAAGLERRTRFATATLMIASNVPDIDVLVFATDIPSVAFRRGWTHGLVGQALLPVLLAGVMMAVARRRPRTDGPPARFCALLGLGYLGLYLHLFMDFLNNYGLRPLAPVSWTWLYGDAVFIIDPWLWLLLGAGVALSRRRRSPVPARWALRLAALYVAAILGSAQAARAYVAGAWEARHGVRPQALMVGPVPVTPFRRTVIVDAGRHYETGTFTWFPRAVQFDAERIPKNDRLPDVGLAKSSPGVAGFLVWSRFPFWTAERAGATTLVTVRDVRFLRTGGFAASATVRSAERDGSAR